ncbi:MAG: MFS transporter [Desulfobacterales bacterium]|nr:MFS transporter [Desulfobacterales bacterium]
MRLFLIILSQFLSGSIWFAANAAFQGQDFLLSAVQAGFIAGTLIFAFFNLADRFSPARLFFISSLFGALFNICPLITDHVSGLLLASRFLCGISLAGIYPVGMKIAASWYPDTLGRALGFLVGALVLASGFPYFIKMVSWQGDPSLILAVTTGLCLTGGIIQVLLVKDGPALPKGSAFSLTAIKKAFSHPGFRAASFGYFGHMWELYALWAFIPVLCSTLAPGAADLLSFAVFGVGFLGCGLGGLLSIRTGSRKIAKWALMGSGFCCLLSPFLHQMPRPLAIGLLLFWGVAVVTDSPQFSSLNARFAPRAYVGSALTIVNCMGFLITIFTIELLSFWVSTWGIRFAFLPLAAGPLFGWISMRRIEGRRLSGT